MSAPGPSVRRECRCPRARHEHGTRTMHDRHGCRCFPCRVASAHARLTNRHGGQWSDATQVLRIGTRRRVEALHAVGWSGGELARHLGITFQAVHSLRTRSNETISPALAERVAALYDALWCVAPVGRHVTKTRNWAARCGFVPPLAWDDDSIDDPAARPQTRAQIVDRQAIEYIDSKDKIPTTRRIPSYIDEIAVERAMRGDPVHLTKHERSEAVAKLTAWKYSATEIAERLGVSDRTVVRRRSAAA